MKFFAETMNKVHWSGLGERVARNNWTYFYFPLGTKSGLHRTTGAFFAVHERADEVPRAASVPPRQRDPFGHGGAKFPINVWKRLTRGGLLRLYVGGGAPGAPSAAGGSSPVPGG